MGMEKGRGGLIVFSGGCAALIWRYAWANFVTLALFHRPFPLTEAFAALFLAAFLSFVSLKRGWRVFQVLGLQMLGYVLAFLKTVHTLHYNAYSLWSLDWFSALINQTRGVMEWLSLTLILFWTLLFWLGGVQLARRPTAYLSTCARFDLGVTFFLLLFLVKFMLLFRGGIKIDDPLSELLLLSFFLFSLLSIGLARNQSGAMKGYLSGYRGLGVVLSFSAVVLFFGAGLVLLFLPYLSLAAEAGYGALKIVSKPFGPLLVRMLRFLFAPGRMRMDPPSSGGSNSGTPGIPVDGGLPGSPFGEMLRSLVFYLGSLALILFGCFLAWLLLKWLFSRTSGQSGGRTLRDLFAFLIERLRASFSFFKNIILKVVGRRKGSIQLYAALSRWGHRSGLPRFLSETPNEYGERLKQRFPVVKNEIGVIINIFNREVYSDRPANDRERGLAAKAWRRMLSPAHWPSRLKAWFFQPGGEGGFAGEKR